MCGIFALFHSHEKLSLIQQQFMLGKRRGPETSSFRTVDEGYIGFHRLAINGLDTESNQPLDIDNCTLICNGEIYNYHQLYDQLFPLIPQTNSDCEIIVHLYRKYGIDYTMHLLDGVFSFILIDNLSKMMYVARDAYGVRPLFYLKGIKTFGFASELKQLTHLYNNILRYHEHAELKQFIPGVYYTYRLYNRTDYTTWQFEQSVRFSQFPFDEQFSRVEYPNILPVIRQTFEQAVIKRVVGTSDRPIACLLSGGLDSSLVASIVSRHVEHLETFSIGMVGGEDLQYAQKVADFLGTRHTSIELTEDEFFDAIPEVIRVIESYDTTTVRASVGNYLVSKYISKNSEAKVIFNGDGSDELMGGYLYFGAAPDKWEFDRECRRLLNNIHSFDVLRSDRSISSNGLEARTPFLDRAWVEFYLSLDKEIRYHGDKDAKMEKYLIREAFDDGTYLPKEILFRKKEAFSDGVSSLQRSWYEIIDEKVIKALHDEEITDDWKALLEEYKDKVNPPTTKEQLYYRALFDIYYPNCQGVIPYFWMPRFVEAKDASARTLKVY